MEKRCPKCGQLLRFPEGVGGVLMACPSCGHKFSSDFRLAGVKRKGTVQRIFELPSELLNKFMK